MLWLWVTCEHKQTEQRSCQKLFRCHFPNSGTVNSMPWALWYTVMSCLMPSFSGSPSDKPMKCQWHRGKSFWEHSPIQPVWLGAGKADEDSPIVFKQESQMKCSTSSTRILRNVYPWCECLMVEQLFSVYSAASVCSFSSGSPCVSDISFTFLPLSFFHVPLPPFVHHQSLTR